MNRKILVATVFIILLWPKVGLAHQVLDAGMQGIVDGNTIHLTMVVHDEKKVIDPEQIQKELRAAVIFSTNGRPCRLDLKHVAVDVDKMTHMDMDVVCNERIGNLDVHSEYKVDAGYQLFVTMIYQLVPTFVILDRNNKDAHFIFKADLDRGNKNAHTVYIFDMDKQKVAPLAHGVSTEKQKEVTWKEAFRRFVVMGMGHIYTGYDHILFVLALILASPQLWPLVKIITAFTIAHSITLILSTLNIVRVSSNIVEPIIAFSIAYVAFEDIINDYRRRNNPSFIIHSKRWLVAFGFGLFHGLGFSGALKEVKIPQPLLIPSLLSFNVGVELAQISIIAAVVPVLHFLKEFQYYRRLIHIILSIIGFMGVAWFVQRVAGFRVY